MILSSFIAHLIWTIVLLSLISDGQAANIKLSSPDNTCKITPSSLVNISSVVNDLVSNYYKDFASLTQSLQGMATLLQLDLVQKVIASSDDQLGNCSSSQQILKNILRKLNNISDVFDTSLQAIATNVLHNQQAIDNIVILVNESKQEKSYCRSSHFLNSCKEIKTKWPHSISGYYYVGSKKGPFYVYCHMEELCGSGGGWTRIAYLDMSDSSEECPTGFRLYQSGGFRACGRQSSNSGGCQSVKFPSNGIKYSQVCGRVVGCQYASPDALDTTFGTGHDDINSHYVDGISLTRGSPRQHVWTFIAGRDSISNTPSFVGEDYFTESGYIPNHDWTGRLWINNPLWDGRKCASHQQACKTPGLLWFNKTLSSITTDYIEMRVCGDQETNDEDVPVNYYEIYIK